AEDGIRDRTVTGVQTCALPISGNASARRGDLDRFAGAAGEDDVMAPIERFGDGRSRLLQQGARGAALAMGRVRVGPGVEPARHRSEERRVGKEGRDRWLPERQ